MVWGASFPMAAYDDLVQGSELHGGCYDHALAIAALLAAIGCHILSSLAAL
jgi:hypothetical protein